MVQNPKNNGEALYSRTVFLNFGCTLERPGKLLKIQCRPVVIFAPSPLHQLIRIWEDFFSVILPSQSCRNQCPTSLPVPLRVWSKFWFTLQAVVTSGTSLQTKSKGLETFTAIWQIKFMSTESNNKNRGTHLKQKVDLQTKILIPTAPAQEDFWIIKHPPLVLRLCSAPSISCYLSKLKH